MKDITEPPAQISDPEIPKGAQPFQISAPSWGAFMAQTLGGLPAVLLVYTGAAPSSRMSAAWHLAVGSLTQRNQPLVHKVFQIVPEKLAGRDLRNELIRSLREEWAKLDWPHDQLEPFLDSLDVLTMSTREAGDLLNILDNIPSGPAAIAILGAETIRYPEFKTDGFATRSTWYGVTFNATTEEHRVTADLFRLSTQIIERVRDRDLFVVIFCEGSPEPGIELPLNLRAEPIFDVAELWTPSEYEQDSRTIHRLLHEGRNTAEILEQVEQLIRTPENRALFTSHVLWRDGKFAAAWQALQPVYLALLEDADSVVLLSASQTALSAGQQTDSKQLLKTAVERGLRGIEMLHTAYLIATHLRIQHLRDEMLNRMKQEYPNSQVTLGLSYSDLMRRRDFDHAQALAERLGYDFDIQAIQAFSQPKLELSKFFDYARAQGQSARAHSWAAHELMQRGEYALARENAEKVDADSAYGPEAMQLQIEAFGRLLRAKGAITTDDVAKLEGLLRYVALHPTDAETRLELEILLETGIEEPAALSLLAQAFGRTFRERLVLISPLVQPALQEQVIDHQEAIYDDSMGFLQEFATSIPKPILLGYGRLPEPLKRFARRDILRVLMGQLRYGLRQGSSDLSWLTLSLHAIVLICRELPDVSEDVVAFRLAVGALANAGLFQKARDIAETALLAVSSEQDRNNWRVAQAWACMADAFHRSGNLLGALRYLVLSLMAWEGPSQSLALSESFLRLASRMFRDAGFAELALGLVGAERQLTLQEQNNEQSLLELEQVELSIEMSQLETGNISAETLASMLQRSVDLLQRAQNHEVGPILSLQANIFRQMRSLQIPIPKEVYEEYQKNVSDQPEAFRMVVNAIVAEKPDKDTLLDLVHNVAKASNWDDLAFQLRPVRLLATKAIQAACESQDLETFITASTILSQPSLSARSWSEAQRIGFNRSAQARTWLADALQNQEASEVVADAAQTAQAVDGALVFTLEQIHDLTLERVKSAPSVSETIVVLALDQHQRLYRATISDLAPDEILRINDDTWDYAKYQDWAKFYPRKYGVDWKAPSTFENEKPSPQDVFESVRKLGIGSIEGRGRLVTLVPDATLFGFPFNLVGTKENAFLLEVCEVATAPSLTWLIEARQKAWGGGLARKAWLGSPDTEDLSLLFLRDKLPPILDTFDIEDIDEAEPIDMSGIALSILVAHGGTGIADNFRTVTDRVRAFSPQEVAASVRDCGCVVLFVCNAGRADQQLWSSETKGLVSALLRYRVRSIVASPWPLEVHFPPTWLSPFLEYLSKGESVGGAVRSASKIIQGIHSSPAAWGAMHVFGDPMYRLPAK